MSQREEGEREREGGGGRGERTKGTEKMEIESEIKRERSGRSCGGRGGINPGNGIGQNIM